MTIYQFNLYATDADNPARNVRIARIERVATKKKPHAILEAYCERSDADVLIAVRYLDWWSLEPLPSFMVSSELISELFDAQNIRIDFIP